MTEPEAGQAKRNPVQLRYKVIAYVATWIAALLLTAPSMWPLAYIRSVPEGYCPQVLPKSTVQMAMTLY